MIGIYYSDAIETGGVVYSYDELWDNTFAMVDSNEWKPLEEVETDGHADWDILILDRVKGKTYAEKKENVRAKAVLYSWLYDMPMSMSDLFNIEHWFHKYGKRYGLLEEFRENGIC